VDGGTVSDQLAVYYRVIERFTELVDSITDEQWPQDTPCEEWTVRDLVEHVVARDEQIAATMGGPPAAELPAHTDLKAAWHERIQWWSERLADPARSQAEWPTYFGVLTFEQATTALMTGEITIHTWDLARALGADETLDHEAVELTYAEIKQHGDQLRVPGAMGAEVNVPPGADIQATLFGFTGRTV
jgi:uncharacterized protein (TIGR03086 family)